MYYVILFYVNFVCVGLCFMSHYTHVFIHLYVTLCVAQRVLLQTVTTVQVVSASVLHAVLATM